jgi:hypothetical protein
MAKNLNEKPANLAPRDSAIKRVQAKIARHVPKTVSLVDELIAERRREAKRERAGASGIKIQRRVTQAPKR